MGSGAESHALGDFVVDAEQLAQSRACQIAHIAGDDDGHGGDGGDAADLVAQSQADGGGDALGHQRQHHDPFQMEQTAQKIHRAQAADGAGHHADENGADVIFQCLEFFIAGDGQANGGRGQKIGQDGAAGLEILVGDVKDDQKGDDEDGGDQQGVQHGDFKPTLETVGEGVADQRQRHREEGAAAEKFNHGSYLPFCGRSTGRPRRQRRRSRRWSGR